RRRHAGDADAFRLAATRQRALVAPIERNAVQRACALIVVKVEAWWYRREWRGTGERHAMPQRDDAVGVGIGQRVEHHALDDREDGDVGSDGQRQRQDRRGGKAGRAAERPDGEAEVLPDGVYHRRLLLGALPRAGHTTASDSST